MTVEQQITALLKDFSVPAKLVYVGDHDSDASVVSRSDLVGALVTVVNDELAKRAQ